MVLEIAVDSDKVMGVFPFVIGILLPQKFIRLYPLRQLLPQHSGSIQLLQEQDIRIHPRPGIGLERIVWQTDRSKQLTALCNIFSGFRILLVHGSAADPIRRYKGDHTARTYFINGLCNEVIVDEKFLPVIATVYQLISAKGNISHRHIKETVRKLRLFKSADGNIRFRIKELCDPSGNAVKLHTIHVQPVHALRHQPQEISDPAGRLQNISFLQSHIFQCFIHGFDHHRRRVKGVQGGFPCRLIFLRIKFRIQFDKLVRPGFTPFLECFLQAAPSHIAG